MLTFLYKNILFLRSKVPSLCNSLESLSPISPYGDMILIHPMNLPDFKLCSWFFMHKICSVSNSSLGWRVKIGSKQKFPCIHPVPEELSYSIFLKIWHERKNYLQILQPHPFKSTTLQNNACFKFKESLQRVKKCIKGNNSCPVHK